MNASEIFNAHMVITRMIDPSSRTFDAGEAAWLISNVPSQPNSPFLRMKQATHEIEFFDVPPDPDVWGVDGDPTYSDHQKIARYRVLHLRGKMEIAACERDRDEVRDEYCLYYNPRSGAPRALRRLKALQVKFRRVSDDGNTIRNRSFKFSFWRGWKKPAALLRAGKGANPKIV
ncbi:MAG: hypothetical protein KDJ49_04110 [Alphaproteobacteria bacterium]|nr:hypothetical protein [Alphaproteobacteria bacterium]USO07658.1 MAG: hypothetical protein H6866_09680 [Rhodospirillales bacterium]